MTTHKRRHTSEWPTTTDDNRSSSSDEKQQRTAIVNKERTRDDDAILTTIASQDDESQPTNVLGRREAMRITISANERMENDNARATTTERLMHDE